MLVRLGLTENDWQQVVKAAPSYSNQNKLVAENMEKRFADLLQRVCMEPQFSAQQDTILNLLVSLDYIQLEETEQQLLKSNRQGDLAKRYKKMRLNELTQAVLISEGDKKYINLIAYQELKNRAKKSPRAAFNLTLIKIEKMQYLRTANWEDKALQKLKALPAWYAINTFSPEQRVIRARIYLHMALTYLYLYQKKQQQQHLDGDGYCLEALTYFTLAKEDGDTRTYTIAQPYLTNLRYPIRWYPFEQDLFEERRQKLLTSAFLFFAILLATIPASIFIASHGLPLFVAPLGLWFLYHLGTLFSAVIAGFTGIMAAGLLVSAMHFSIKAQLLQRSTLFFKRLLRNAVRFFIPTDFIKNKILLLNSQIEELRSLLEEKERENKQLTLTNEDLNRQLKSYKPSVLSEKRDKNVRLEEIEPISTGSRSAITMVDSSTQVQHGIHDQIGIAIQELTTLRQSETSLTQQLQKEKELNTNLAHQLNELEQRLIEAEAQKQINKETISQLEKQFADQQTSVATLSEEKQQAQQSAEHAKQLHQSLQQHAKKLETQLQHEKAYIKKLEDLLHNKKALSQEEHQNQQQQIDQIKADYEHKLKDLNNQYQILEAYEVAAQARAKQEEAEIIQLKETNHNYKNEIAELQATLAEKEAKIEQLTHDLDKAKNNIQQLNLALGRKISLPFLGNMGTRTQAAWTSVPVSTSHPTSDSPASPTQKR
jgi:regulator of replication initiation timing